MGGFIIIYLNRKKEILFENLTEKMAAKISPYSAEDFPENEVMMIDKGDDNKVAGTKFDISTKSMAKTAFPVINDNASVKIRLSTLESTSSTQIEYNRHTLDSFGNLADNLNVVDLNLQDLLRQAHDHFTVIIANLKKEYDHK